VLARALAEPRLGRRVACPARSGMPAPRRPSAGEPTDASGNPGASMQLTVRDAARFLRVPERTIYRWIREGSIPPHRGQEQYRFEGVELLEWARRQKIAVAPEIFHEAEPSETVPSVAEAIEEGGVHPGLAGADKESVIRSVVAVLRLPDETERESVYSAF